MLHTARSSNVKYTPRCVLPFIDKPSCNLSWGWSRLFCLPNVLRNVPFPSKICTRWLSLSATTMLLKLTITLAFSSKRSYKRVPSLLNISCDQAGKGKKERLIQLLHESSAAPQLRYLSTRHMVSFIDFYFHFIANLALSLPCGTLFFFIRTSNFDAEAERSYIFWRFEAETFLKMFLNLPGIVFQPISADVTRQTIKEHFLLRYHLMTLMVSKSFWNNYE